MTPLRLRSLGLLLLPLLLAACAPAPVRETPREPVETPSGQVEQPGQVPPERPAEPPVREQPESSALRPLPPAARNLVAQAERASADGRHNEAVALLERAVRIAPRHPLVWQNLAVVRYRQSDYQQAESLAQRSNAVAGGETALRRANWELIAAARRLRGDAGGAAQAAAEARRLDDAR